MAPHLVLFEHAAGYALFRFPFFKSVKSIYCWHVGNVCWCSSVPPIKVVPISTISVVRVREFEEVAAFLPQVEEAVSDVSKFSSVIVFTEH